MGRRKAVPGSHGRSAGESLFTPPMQSNLRNQDVSTELYTLVRRGISLQYLFLALPSPSLVTLPSEQEMLISEARDRNTEEDKETHSKMNRNLSAMTLLSTVHPMIAFFVRHL
ncbi:uncharacterized protein UTRI_00091 [Ustilago trichophora]|uniref:Uncharacterized protein n=1 Tax=Ustilago trichophora TaxID=86804 RepID=A0A5C3DQI0_9BASI|nr:uncharacterized protein UTRI_00091 [Ustilago trichophora]